MRGRQAGGRWAPRETALGASRRRPRRPPRAPGAHTAALRIRPGRHSAPRRAGHLPPAPGASAPNALAASLVTRRAGLPAGRPGQMHEEGKFQSGLGHSDRVPPLRQTGCPPCFPRGCGRRPGAVAGVQWEGRAVRGCRREGHPDPHGIGAEPASGGGVAVKRVCHRDTRTWRAVSGVLRTSSEKPSRTGILRTTLIPLGTQVPAGRGFQTTSLSGDPSPKARGGIDRSVPAAPTPDQDSVQGARPWS